MIKTDEDALICDLAETYQIYDYRQLPPLRVAVFACGLKDDSRIKLKLHGQLVPLETLLLARVSDSLSTLIWFQTEDGQKGRNRPTSLMNLFMGGSNKKESNKDVIIFNSGEDFAEQRQRLLKGG